MARLGCKFGGERLNIALHIEELDNIKFLLRPENVKDLECFADLLDVTVLNLKVKFILAYAEN